MAGQGAGPQAAITMAAGLALLPAFAGAAQGAFRPEATRFAAAVTLVATAGGVSLPGIGAAFWGLALGLVVYLGDSRLR